MTTNKSFVHTFIITVADDKLISDQVAQSKMMAVLSKMEDEEKIVGYQMSVMQVING